MTTASAIPELIDGVSHRWRVNFFVRIGTVVIGMACGAVWLEGRKSPGIGLAIPQVAVNTIQ